MDWCSSWSGTRSGNTVERYLIHSLSHLLGMDVHDVGNYLTPLATGDVITLEPAIYLFDEKLGVRVEDDYLVTANGLEKISKNIPSAPDDIERMIRGGKGHAARQ